MVEANPINPEPDPQVPASKPAADPEPVLITDGAAAQLFAAGRSPTTSGRRAWQPPSVADLQRMLPQYEILEMIGRGGMGAVYRSVQRTLDREVAIKILPPEIAAEDAQFPERFKLEGKAMAQLNHPGIVAAFDAGETSEGLLYFVMEYVEGTDVQAMLKTRGPLPAEEALTIVAHVCEALEFAHARGFVHRDIKPSNIMVDAHGRVKVADFGLAKAISCEGRWMTGESIAIGTADFAAPEAFLPEVKLDGRADLYSVGVMLYQMLTGQIPRGRFEGPSIRVPGLDPRIDAIIDRAMQTDRERRYPTAGEMRADLKNVLASRPTGSSRDTPRQRWLLIGTGVAAFAVVLAASKIIRERMHPSVEKVAAKLAPAHSEASASENALRAAAAESPYVNSLGMRFVPVPIVGGPTAGQRVLFSIWETRVQDYEVFAKASKHEWLQPGFPQGPTDPVVNVNWDDAEEFCAWLSEREQKSGSLSTAWRYRLPSDHEWSCAVGIGDREDPARTPDEKSKKLADVFPWGTAWPLPRGAGNFSGEEAAGHQTWPEQSLLSGYRDDFPMTSPVGSFRPNRFGLFDLGGNAWEWCEDLLLPGQPSRVMRGASFNNGSRGGLLSSNRDSHLPGSRNVNYGFRLILAETSATSSPATGPAWKPVPFKLNARLDDGFVHLVKFDFWNLPNSRMSNTAVRAVIAWQPNQPGSNDYIKVTARLRDNEHYYAYLTGPSVEVGHFQAPTSTPLQRWTVSPPPAAGETISLQFACIGRHLAVWVRGRLIGTCDDDSFSEAGSVGVQASDGHIQDLEYMNLDDLPEARALALLGIGAATKQP